MGHTDTIPTSLPGTLISAAPYGGEPHAQQLPAPVED